MDAPIARKNIIVWLFLALIPPIILTSIMILQWDEENGVLMTTIIAIIWAITAGIVIYMIRDAIKNPYPLFYLVDCKTLIEYMNEEERFSFERNLEAGFHYYLYHDNKKIEIQSWYYSFSDSEKDKSNVYYWDKEEFHSLEDLINAKIAKFDGYVLIELIDGDNNLLKEYKNNHKELDVSKYIKESRMK